MNELGSKAMELIVKAENTAPHVWEVLLRQARIDGFVALATSVVLWLCMYGLRAWFRSLSGDDRDLGGIPCIVGGIFCFIFGLIFAASAATSLLNPEYRAFHLLLENVK